MTPCGSMEGHVAPCPGQVEPEVREAVWTAMLEFDPVGATWGTGVRRAPSVTTWGWTREEVARQRTPTLLVAPETDGQVPPESVAELYEDFGAGEKVLVRLACSSHNAGGRRTASCSSPLRSSGCARGPSRAYAAARYG